jgi:hypothetical protein
VKVPKAVEVPNARGRDFRNRWRNLMARYPGPDLMRNPNEAFPFSLFPAVFLTCPLERGLHPRVFAASERGEPASGWPHLIVPEDERGTPTSSSCSCHPFSARKALIRACKRPGFVIQCVKHHESVPRVQATPYSSIVAAQHGPHTSTSTSISQPLPQCGDRRPVSPDGRGGPFLVWSSLSAGRAALKPNRRGGGDGHQEDQPHVRCIG